MKTLFEKYRFILTVCITLFCLCIPVPISSVTAQPVLFDFDNAPLHSPFPINLTIDGITAHLSATGQGYSIQYANVLGFTPQGFAGLIIYPNSIFPADLLVSFDHTLTKFSIMYTTQELECDDAARMKVTAYMNGSLVGFNTRTATFPGTWPTDTLSCSFPQGFNSVVVHYDAPPPTCQDYGMIFMADNMIVTPDIMGGILTQKIFIQGFYNPVRNSMVPDTLMVLLRGSTPPFPIAEVSTALFDSSGTGVFDFGYIFNGIPYYIHVLHRNSIETWSASAVTFVNNSLNYDFTTAAGQAYGNNMIQIDASPLRFGIYGGDIDQNLIIDLTDIDSVYNAAVNFISGYVATDVTGDDIVDLSDITLTYNNSAKFVISIDP